MGVIATEVAALEKQFAEAAERASRLEKELAAARARPKPKTTGRTLVDRWLATYHVRTVPAPFCGMDDYTFRTPGGCFARDIDEAIDEARDDEREAILPLVSEWLESNDDESVLIEAIRARK
jgi:hypothetical protein